MAYVPTKGHTLRMPSGPNNHLHVVLTGISTTLTHLLVNFSTIKDGVVHDPACLVGVGDHPFITAPSYMAYQFARIEMAHDLANRVDSTNLQSSIP